MEVTVPGLVGDDVAAAAGGSAGPLLVVKGEGRGRVAGRGCAVQGNELPGGARQVGGVRVIVLLAEKGEDGLPGSVLDLQAVAGQPVGGGLTQRLDVGPFLLHHARGRSAVHRGNLEEAGLELALAGGPVLAAVAVAAGKAAECLRAQGQLDVAPGDGVLAA
jgi:hypothetical protein